MAYVPSSGLRIGEGRGIREGRGSKQGLPDAGRRRREFRSCRRQDSSGIPGRSLPGARRQYPCEEAKADHPQSREQQNQVSSDGLHGRLASRAGRWSRTNGSSDTWPALSLGLGSRAVPPTRASGLFPGNRLMVFPPPITWGQEGELVGAAREPPQTHQLKYVKRFLPLGQEDGSKGGEQAPPLPTAPRPCRMVVAVESRPLRANQGPT